MKAQAALEYLSIIIIVIAILIPIFIYSLDTSNTNIRSSNAQEAANKIATEADNLYKLGGGKSTIFVRLPNGVNSVFIGDNSIQLSLNIGSSVSDIVVTTKASVNGSIDITEGVKKVILEVIEDTVQISG